MGYASRPAVLGPTVPVYSTAMMIGMVRVAPNAAEISAYAGPIHCGPMLGDDIGPLTKLLDVAQQGFVPMTYDPAIRETISFKLHFNSCMNPTGALTGQTYGELLESPAYSALIVGLADETLAAFARAFDCRPAQSGQHYVDKILSAIVSKGGGKHRGSMLQDLQSGRKAEIAFLNGFIIGLAQDHGLSAVRHDVVRQLIVARET